jgi:hypothetical protein
MLRFALSAIALAGVLATAHPAFADPLAATPCDHAEVAAAGAERTAAPQPARPSSTDAKAPANTGIGKDVVPVGFGWG